MSSTRAVSAARVAGVVLAAGASRRLGVPKQLLVDDHSGLVLVARAAQQLLDAGFSPVVVVTGAQHEAVSHALADLSVSICFNERFEEGMGTSIGCAVEWLSSLDSVNELAGVAIAACDMPSVTVEHLKALLEISVGGTNRVASRYEDASGLAIFGIPAIFPKMEWHALRNLPGDRGARGLLNSPDTLSVFLRMGSFDLDTPDDVVRWRARDQP